jgi:Uma2 family endonuclease
MTSETLTSAEGLPIVLQLHPAIALTDDQFFELCQINRDWRFERTTHGELVIMSPTGSETGNYNFDLLGQLWAWTIQDGTGKGFDSSTGFTLPNGAVRSPDAAWIKLSRWEALPEAQRKKFAPICPDFVIELRSEYLQNGARLGWLLDREHQTVYVYRPQLPVQVLEKPATISGDPVLPGFVLDLSRIW